MKIAKLIVTRVDNDIRLLNANLFEKKLLISSETNAFVGKNKPKLLSNSRKFVFANLKKTFNDFPFPSTVSSGFDSSNELFLNVQIKKEITLHLYTHPLKTVVVLVFFSKYFRWKTFFFFENFHRLTHSAFLYLGIF